MNTFGARLAKAREIKGMNRSELARKIGVTPQRVTQVESGTGELGPGPAVRAAKTLNVRVEWLALAEGPMTAQELPATNHEPLEHRSEISADEAKAIREMWEKLTEEQHLDHYLATLRDFPTIRRAERIDKLRALVSANRMVIEQLGHKFTGTPSDEVARAYGAVPYEKANRRHTPHSPRKRA